MSAIPTQAEAAAAERDLMGGLLIPRDVVLVRGEGTTVWDREGRAYLDFTGGYGTASLGHCHPELVAAIVAQASRLIACPTLFAHEERGALLDALRGVFPARAGIDRFFLCNSGTEAVEGAIKLARFTTGRSGIVAAKRGFHGRTVGALSATWEPKYRDPFGPLLAGVTHVRFDDAAALAEAIDASTAAVLLEVVQGEGGVHVAGNEFLQSAATLCRERGAMLILDEVQTGFGRTGRMFAFEHADVVPDLVCLAKGMGGGFPVGCVAIGSRIAPLASGLHGSTFGGNPLAAAAARCTIRVLEEDGLPVRAERLGRRFRAGLAALNAPLIREVRGLGLMVGVELRQRALPYLRALQEEGVLALLAGSTVLRFLPPLTVAESEIDRAIDAVARALAESSVAAQGEAE